MVFNDLNAKDISRGRLSDDDEKKLQDAINGVRDYYIRPDTMNKFIEVSMRSDDEDGVDNLLNTMKDNLKIFNKHRKDLFDLIVKANDVE